MTAVQPKARLQRDRGILVGMAGHLTGSRSRNRERIS